jgi:hypothetical protein
MDCRPRRSLSGRLNPKDKGYGPVRISSASLSKHGKIERL